MGSIYQFHKNTDPVKFDQFVMQSDQNSLHQCTNWAKVKKNWMPYYISVTDEAGEICATALVLSRTLVGRKKLFYIPKGPVMDYRNDELVTFLFVNLIEMAKSEHAVAIRFDPNILLRKYPYVERKEYHQMENVDIISILEKHGAKHNGFTTFISESTQPRFNAEMDVVENWKKELEHKTAKCIRSAQRKGIEILEGKEYLPQFALAMHYTEKRKNIALRNEEYFKDMLDAYGDEGICMVSVLNFPKQISECQKMINEANMILEDESASKKKKNAAKEQLDFNKKQLDELTEAYNNEGQDEVVTSGILACYNDKLMELFYMGNNPDYLRYYGSYLLYATCIDRCRELNIPYCSFGGIEGTLDDGLTLFKSNWTMNVEEYIGEFNIVLDPFIYNAFDKVYPKALSLAAKLRGKK